MGILCSITALMYAVSSCVVNVLVSLNLCDDNHSSMSVLTSSIDFGGHSSYEVSVMSLVCAETVSMIVTRMIIDADRMMRVYESDV